MLTTQGASAVLNALSQISRGWKARFNAGGVKLPQDYSIDPGYPQVGDKDPLNTGRGTEVLTWRVTVPRGINLGQAEVREAEMLNDKNEPVYRVSLDTPFKPSMSFPTIIFINFALQKR